MDYFDALEYGEKQDRRGSGRKGVRTNKARGKNHGCTGRCGMCSLFYDHQSKVRHEKKRYNPGGMIPIDVACTGRKGMVEYFVNPSNPGEVRARFLLTT